MSEKITATVAGSPTRNCGAISAFFRASQSLGSSRSSMAFVKCHKRAKRIRGIVCLAVLSLFCSARKAFAQTVTAAASDGDSASQPRQHLLGDWDGERTALASRGVTFDFFYVADLQANPVGGLEQTQAGWGRIRGTMDIDFGKLTDWEGLTFHVTGLWQFGGNLGADIGTLANPSGLVSAHTTRLDSFWLQQAFLHNRLFIRAGQLRDWISTAIRNTARLI